MLIFIEREIAKAGKRAETACAMWTLDGRAFLIRDQDELVKTILPRIFQKSKFSSFTRKLYRWGFRQIYTDGASKKSDHRDMIFASENFQRDNKHLLANMRSTTAEGARRELNVRQPTGFQEIPSGSQQEGDEPVVNFRRSSPPSVVTISGTQPSLRQDILALLASSESALSRPMATAMQPLQTNPFSNTGDLPMLPFLTNFTAQQQNATQPSQNGLVASLLMLAAAREGSVSFPAQQQLLLHQGHNYHFESSVQLPLTQSALAAYTQQQQDHDAASTVRQLLANILAQSNQNPSPFLSGQQNPPARCNQNQNGSQPRF